ncbi:MAG: hypothetical protein J5771_07530 [Bacteroidales bacterium]|nr:hypothetical protein [Bacteroidales bacterium]
MSNKLNLTQLEIFTSLLKSTCNDYRSTKVPHDHIVVGAHATVFAFRNFGAGIPSGNIARAVLPLEGEQPQLAGISELYDFVPLFGADIFELRSFRREERTILRYKKGEMELFSVCPDKTNNGLVLMLEWKNPLAAEQILTPEEATMALQDIVVSRKSPCRLTWWPNVWLNGVLLEY